MLSTTGREDPKHCDVLGDFLEKYFYSFETKVVCTDCDLKKEIEDFSADLVFYLHMPEMLAVKKPLVFPENYDCYPEIPRIGMAGGDKYSPVKYASYNALRKLKCQAGVCSLTAGGELIYEADDLPLYHKLGLLYTSILRDYGEEKIIPVGLFGAGFAFGTENNNHYQWRQRVTKQLLNRVPLFHAPRPSAVNIIKNSHDLVKEKYGRMLNRCKVALTCGTEQHNILEKHLEIPACRTCLVTEESNIVKDYGFRDMENCVFADETNICEKLEYLFVNSERLQEITDAGYELVQQYLDKEKAFDFYYELYKLLKVKKEDERIIQDGVSSFRIVKKNSGELSSVGYGPDYIRQQWENGFNYLLADDADKAMQSFNNALSYVSYAPEAVTGIGIVSLFSGKIQQAEQCFLRNIAHVQRQAGLGLDLCDPVEVAYLVIIYIITNRVGEAQRVLKCMVGVGHPALTAVGALLNNDSSLLSNIKTRKSRIPFDFEDSQKWYGHFAHAITIYR